MIKLTLLDTGFCRQLEKMSLANGRMKTIKFHALVALLEHPVHGYMLFDTGYAKHFLTYTKSFPYSLYPMITPVSFTDDQAVVQQLKNRGIAPEDVRYLFLSHFHADHIAGVRDFPQATIYCFKTAYDAVKNRSGFSAVRHGFIPQLLPDDFIDRVVFIDEEQQVQLSSELIPFTHGYDVFQDGTLLVLDLSGHTAGQFGLYTPATLILNKQNQKVLLCADAAWSTQAIREYVKPHHLAYWIMDDGDAYNTQLFRLHQLTKNNPSIKIIPTHCQEVRERWQKEMRQPE